MKLFTGIFLVFWAFAAPAFAQIPGMSAVPAASYSPVLACTLGGNDGFTKALLHMDGANGGTSFPDNNGAGISAAWSTSGSAVTTTSAFKFGTASYQGATNSFIRSNQTSVYWPNSSDFTVDFWFRGDPSLTSTQQTFAQYGGTTNDGTGGATLGWSVVYRGSDGRLSITITNAGISGSSALTPSAAGLFDNTWHYLEFNRAGSTYHIFIDGVNSVNAASAPSGSVATSGTFTLSVGGSVQPGFTAAFLGQIDEFRYRIGVAGNTSNYLPPSLPWCN